MTSRYHTRSNSAKKSSDGPNHSHIVSNTNTNSKGLSRHRPSNNQTNIINRSPDNGLWHDHVSVRGQECNSGLFVERRREGINDFSLDKPNVHIQSSFHHTTGSNSFIPQSINFSISHFNFIDNMDNRTSVGSQGVNQYHRHLRSTSVSLFCPRRIFQRFFHLSITLLIGRYPPISAHHHHHHSSPLYSQSMFNSISIQFHRVHLYRQSVFNLIRTQYRRLTVCSKIKTWKSQVSNFPNVQVPFLKIPVSKVPILQKCSD